MLQEPRPKVLGLANVNPESVEETVDARGFGCVLQDTFALKEVPAVTSLGEADHCLLSLDYHLPDRQRPRHGAERGTQPVSFATRSFLVIGSDEQSHLRTAIRNAHVVARGIEPGLRLLHSRASRGRSDDFVSMLQAIFRSEEETT